MTFADKMDNESRKIEITKIVPCLILSKNPGSKLAVTQYNKIVLVVHIEKSFFVRPFPCLIGILSF